MMPLIDEDCSYERKEHTNIGLIALHLACQHPVHVHAVAERAIWLRRQREHVPASILQVRDGRAMCEIARQVGHLRCITRTFSCKYEARTGGPLDVSCCAKCQASLAVKGSGAPNATSAGISLGQCSRKCAEQ